MSDPRRPRPTRNPNWPRQGNPPDPGNPFNTYEAPFKNGIPSYGPYDSFASSFVAGTEEQKKRQEQSGVNPISVALPRNLFIPEGAQSTDMSVLANIPASTTQEIFTFRCPSGTFVNFIGYAIFNDALLLSLIDFVPTVNGVRVFPFHGNPNLAFKIGLGTGADMQTLIPCQLVLQPNDVLRWTFTNNDTVDVAAGVRMSGYLDQSTTRKSFRFGG